MPRFLAMVREKKILKWEQAIQKLTSEPAKLLGLSDRGTLTPKNAADVVVFDPQTVVDRADYQNPIQLSVGIDAVVVNGKVAFGANHIPNLNGQVIKR